MDWETISLEILEGVATITFNRPDRLNSFNEQMHGEVAAALDVVKDEETSRVLVITGAGRAFCAGQDLSDRALAPVGSDVDLGESLAKWYNPLVRKIVGLDLPVICAVNGVAAGAGANIALAADLVVARKSAKFIQSFANIGLVPDSGGTWILPRLVGQARAMGLALTGEPLSAVEAEEWGLIWKAVDDEKFEEEVRALAIKLAAAPTRGLAATKGAIRAAGLLSLDAQLDLERDLQRMLGQTEDYQEGVSAFLEKRTPSFKGR